MSDALRLPPDIAAKIRPCPHSVPLVRNRPREARRSRLRGFWVALACAAVGWLALLAWGSQDFRAAYGDKQLQGCALVGEKLRCW